MHNRRDFLTTGAAAAAGGVLLSGARADHHENDDKDAKRLRFALIGCGGRGTAVMRGALKYADLVACADPDRTRRDKTAEQVGKQQGEKGGPSDVQAVEDYAEILKRDDLDFVIVGTTDHWHTKPCVEAMRAGLDVYCEKPLTLTIEEGKIIRRVLDETGRVFQVGTQQRSEMGLRFLKAVAMVRDGRIGELKKVQCAIGGSPSCQPLDVQPVGDEVNWDMWLGQAPMVDYRATVPLVQDGGGKIPGRGHYNFRWWYEYSGGKLTDWGAHHVDIATWALGMGDSGPVEVVPISAEHPVPFEDGMPTEHDRYNCATRFMVQVRYPGGQEMLIRNDTRNGITLTGTEGEFFVGRGELSGKPVDELEDKPLPVGLLTELYKGKQPGSHMKNFVECIADRSQPISDVHSHHRALTTCHLANIAIRLNRPIKWDAQAEQIVGDEQARAMQAREQRAGYEIPS